LTEHKIGQNELAELLLKGNPSILTARENCARRYIYIKTNA